LIRFLVIFRYFSSPITTRFRADRNTWPQCSASCRTRTNAETISNQRFSHAKRCWYRSADVSARTRKGSRLRRLAWRPRCFFWMWPSRGRHGPPALSNVACQLFKRKVGRSTPTAASGCAIQPRLGEEIPRLPWLQRLPDCPLGSVTRSQGNTVAGHANSWSLTASDRHRAGDRLGLSSLRILPHRQRSDVWCDACHRYLDGADRDF